MNQHTENWRKREISRLEDGARRDDAHANAMDTDARDLRRRAETARKTAEYLRKSDETPAPVKLELGWLARDVECASRRAAELEPRADMNEKIEAAGWLVTFADGGKCVYFAEAVAEWKAGEFSDSGRTVASTEPLYLATALPPLRAREEIARALYKTRMGLNDRQISDDFADYAKDPRGYDYTRINVFDAYRCADAVVALSLPAGQEWREPEGSLTKDIRDAVWEVLSAWRPGMSDEVKHTLSAKVADRVAHRSDAPLPAPPVAEPIVAEQRPEGK